MEERGLREDDWNDPLDSREESCADGNNQKFAPKSVIDKSKSVDKGSKKEEHNNSNVISDETRKKILNAPKRLKKIESLIEKHESDIKVIDEEMIQVQ
jgi:hypothetical protein